MGSLVSVAGYDTGMPCLATVGAQDHDAIAAALEATGACVLLDFPHVTAGLLLARDLKRLQAMGALRTAAIGQGRQHQQHSDVRGDSTLWLDDPRCGQVAAHYLQHLHTLRTQLNRRLFLGLDEDEAHYACYPPGTSYQRHRDSFQHSDSRVLSLVSYLNEDWKPEHGGRLRLHLESGPVEIAPTVGTGICFLSTIEHEVLPATRERLSIAAWMRKRDN